jgi:hypothetical protein
MSRSYNAAVAVLAALVLIAVIPGTTGFATVPRWALLAVAVPMLLMWASAEDRIIGHGPEVPLVLFLCWAALSFLWAANTIDAIGALMKWAIIGGTFMVGLLTTNMRAVWIGAGVGIVINCAVAGAQLHGTIDWAPTASGDHPAGLFFNRTLLAEVAALVLVGCAVYRVWWAIPPALFCVAVSGSRVGIVVILFAALAYAAHVASRLRNRVDILPALAVAAAAFTALMLALWSRMPSTSERVNVLLDTWNGLTWFGRGIGSFETAFPSVATRIDTYASWTEHAHNDWLEVAFELGVPGVLLLAALYVLCFVRGREPERIVLAAFIGETLVGFPSHMPATAFLAALVAGHMCRHRDLVFEQFIDCRIDPLPRYHQS